MVLGPVVGRLGSLIVFLTSRLAGILQRNGSQSFPMSKEKISGGKAAPFGTVLGITDGETLVYSCEYETLDKSIWKNMSFFESTFNGTYCGFKYQCVELARRYLLINHGVVFDSIPMAYDIFRLRKVRRVADNQHFKMTAYRNGSTTLPVKGSLLIWEPRGYFKHTGHVAVIIDVTDTHVDIVEQNVEDSIWPDGINYSRRLPVSRDGEGHFHIGCTFSDTKLLGWTIIDYDQTYSVEQELADLPNCNVDQLKKAHVDLPPNVNSTSWLDTSKEYIQAFIRKCGPNVVGAEDAQAGKAAYFTLTDAGETSLSAASAELHSMFLNATDYVIHHQEEVGRHFHVPDKLWPRIQQSWFRRHDDMVAGRFDLALTKSGLKAYEYNADSASCLLECGYVQHQWAKAVGLSSTPGRDTGDTLFDQLVEAWKKKSVTTTLHLMCDDDDEERYTAMYMKAAAEAAGITCRLLVGLEGLSFTPDGLMVRDPEGVVMEAVWKTWSWRTALAELSDDDVVFSCLEECKPRDTEAKPRLVDILLNQKVRVFEPLWTLIPSSKAILAVLWSLHPNHPYLLKSSFELTPELQASGYVTKPVGGRAGNNVKLIDPKGQLLVKTEGQFTESQDIYQELCVLPKLDEWFVQVCTWVVDQEYAGTVARADEKSIIDYESSVIPIRVVPQ